MSSESETLRKKAAEELKRARKTKSPQARATHIKTATSYKTLAENEAWLAGEKKKPSQVPPKQDEVG